MRAEWTGILERREFEIFGKRLVPFSLGHLFLLELIESPLVKAAQTGGIEPKDIFLAVWLCSMPHEAARDSLYSPEIGQRFEAWGAAWGRRSAKAGQQTPSFLTEAEAFREYLAYWMRGPRRWSKTRPGQPTSARLKTPWLLYIVAELLRCRQVQTRAEAWALPCCEGFAHFAAIAEAQGDDSLFDDRDYAAHEAVKAGTQ